METKRLINQLKKYPEDAILKLHSLHSTGGEVIDVTRVYDGTRYVAVLETTQDLTYPVEFNTKGIRYLTIGRLVAYLEKNMELDERVLAHNYYGNEELFALQIVGHEEYVVFEDTSDINMTEELSAQFEHAAEEDLDETDFFMDILEMGFTLDHIKQYLPERYEYSKNYMEEHGLI